ncbi:MAG TPA: signal peptidase I [Dehalococcoidia bacterium]
MWRKHLSLVLAVALLLGWYALLRPAALGGPISYIKVSGASMEPTLYGGDFALVRRAETYGPGDVIAYRAEDGIVIHRIIGGTAEEGYVTRGDNRTTTDPWRPRPQHILGKLWFHVPDLGSLVHRLQQPALFAAVAGGFAALSVAGGRRLRRSRRRRRRRADAEHGPRPRSLHLTSSSLMVVVAGLALATAAFLALAVYAFRQPAEGPQTVQHRQFTHTVRFDYTAGMVPSPLYPDGVVSSAAPAAPGQEAGTPPEPPPLFRRLARTLDVGVTYRAVAEEPLELTGQYRADLEIVAEDGWRHTVPLVPPTPFAGQSVAFRVPLDLQQVFAFVNQIQGQTGFTPRRYELRLVPTIEVAGQAGDRPVDGRYAPAFTMAMDAVQLTLAPALEYSQPQQTGETVQADRHAGLLGLSLPVKALRVLGAAGAAAGLLATGIAAAAVVRRLGKESERIRMRFGSRLVSVSRAEFHGDEQRIRVASMQDLVRLAEQDGRMILHLEEQEGLHVFAIPDGLVLYEYVVDERPSDLASLLPLRKNHPNRLASSS